MNNNEVTGFLLIDKPKGPSSFQCVAHIKRLLPKGIKIGHAGALDPFATGLLIIAISRNATKQIDSLLNKDKTYLVKAKLGELTDTLDYTGTILQTKDTSHITKQSLLSAIKALGITYKQIPPAYCALKHQGKPLYKLARSAQNNADLQEILKNKIRNVHLYHMELIAFENPYFTFQAHVSKGTYIRTLTNDLAKQCGNIATTYELQRTKIGTISLEKAISLDKIQDIDDIKKHLISLS